MAWTETINFTNDTMNARSRDAFAAIYGWTGTHNGQPETKGQFRARKLKEHIKEVTRAHEKQAALASVPDITVEN